MRINLKFVLLVCAAQSCQSRLDVMTGKKDSAGSENTPNAAPTESADPVSSPESPSPSVTPSATIEPVVSPTPTPTVTAPATQGFESPSPLQLIEGTTATSTPLNCSSSSGLFPAFSITSQTDPAANCSLTTSTQRLICTPVYKAGFANWSSSVTIQCDINGATFTQTMMVNVTDSSAYLKAANAGANDGFANDRHSIDTDGTTLVVGAWAEDSTSSTPNDLGSDTGAAYVYARVNGMWEQQAYLKASFADNQDYFGVSVAVSGDTIAVGALEEDSNGTGESNNGLSKSGAVYIFVRDTNGIWNQQAFLKASVPNGSDRFGHDLALEGDVLVVGAKKEDSQALDGGGFYIFRRSGVTWAQEKWVSGTVNYGDFAASISISGNTVVATGLYQNAQKGNCHIYVYDGSDWNLQQVVTASNPDTNDEFGFSVAVAGNRLAIGAPLEDSDGTSGSDNSATDSGAVYIFERVGTVWTETAYIKANVVGAGDVFGHRIAIEGDFLAVGAKLEDSIGNDPADNSLSDAGAAYLFKFEHAVWSQKALLKARSPNASGKFGSSLALKNGILAIGEGGDDSSVADPQDASLPGSGAANIFVVPSI